MADSANKTSDPERRVSTRTSRGVSLTHNGPPILEEMDYDEEDYALMALGIMPSNGGYQPASEQTYSPAPAPTHTPAFIPATTFDDRRTSYEPDVARPDSPVTPTTSATTPSPGPTSSPTRLNRSSISKPPRDRDSLTLRHDGSMGQVAASRPQQLTRQPSVVRSSVVSTASSEAGAYLVSDGPYRGPTAPSHSYSFYPQDTRPARTMSIATTSTMPSVRPESEYNGPTGPSHPYSMYPQMPLEEATPEPAVPAIPVGFATAADPYQRRLGPEGEELADIIGPDGHTEELPPYTRYPDEFYARKIRGDNDSDRAGEGAGPAAVVAPVAVTTMAAVPTADANTIPGAGGIGLAARNPEFDARSVDDVASPASRHSARSFTSDSHHEINTAAAAISEKPQLGKWQKLAKKKACGVIPYWALGLTFTAVLIVLVIVAAVIGSLISHRGPSPKKATSTNYQDSMPSATITFDAIPIPTPSDLPALAQGTFGLPLNLNSAPNTCFNDTAQSSAWSCNIAFNQAVALQLQITRNAPQLGRDGTYDVMLITNYSSNGSPDDDDGDVSLSDLMYGTTAPLIQPAMNMELVNDTFDLDRGPAWFRMLPYNKTVILPEESFSSSTSKQRRNGPGSGPTAGNFQRKGVAQAGDKPWICVWPDTFVEIFIYATQNSSFASQSSATVTTEPSSAATSASTATGSAATATPTESGTGDIPMPPPLALYPRAIKLKERRVNESPRAYCYQVTVGSDNTTTPVTDTDNNLVKIDIDEIERSNGMDKRSDGEDGDMSDCGCMWFSS